MMIGRFVVLAALGALLVLPGPVMAASSSSGVTVKVSPHFRLEDGGASIVGKARVSCPVGYTPLEALAFGFQGEDPGATYAEGFLSVESCDGRKHWGVVRVRAFDSVFTKGPARLSAFVLVENAAGDETLDGGDLAKVRVTN